MSEQPPAPDAPQGPAGSGAPRDPGDLENLPEPAEALSEIAASSPDDPEPPAGQDEWSPTGRGRLIWESVLEGNSVTVTVLAILTALVVGGLLNAFTNTTVLHAWGNLFSAPGHAFAEAWDTAAGAYVELFEGSIFNPHTVAALFQQASIGSAIHDGYLSAVFNPLSETCVQATPLILAGLAVALPYQAGLFNIGGQSQFIGGALVATYLGYGVNLPVVVHVVVCVLGGFAGGAAIGWIVGELKARTGAHEVIVTIMANYIMQYLLAYLLSFHYLMQAPTSTNEITAPIAGDAHLPLLFGSHLRINAGFLLALACAAGVWWLLTRTTTGFEFRAIGKNPNAARVAGINVERDWVLVFLIAGGLGGLSGAAVVQGTDFTLNFQSYGTYGIDAITVALLGRGRPLGVVLAGLLFGALHAGAPLMQAVTGTPVDMVEVLQAVIVLFVAAPPLIRGIFRLRAARAGGVGLVLSKGWNA
jgi:general nucleoside transport system permease protein